MSYLSAGPVVATPTKPGRPGTGLDYLSLATRRATVPVFVTGGVTPERVPALAAAGARHFVVVRYLTESDDPASAARRLRQAIDVADGSDARPASVTPFLSRTAYVAGPFKLKSGCARARLNVAGSRPVGRRAPVPIEV